MPACIVHDMKGKKTEEMKLPESVFGGHIRQGVLHQALVMYQANQRQGNASTKERGAVSGGGKKPYRQKGTGQARAGSSRSPLWKGGGVVFGPHPRNFGYVLPKKLKIAALKTSLNSRHATNDLFCVDQFKAETAKTKDFVKSLKELNLTGKVLAVVDSIDEQTVRVSRNISRLSIMRADDVTAYDVLRNKKILITKNAFKNLLKRFKV